MYYAQEIQRPIFTYKIWYIYQLSYTHREKNKVKFKFIGMVISLRYQNNVYLKIDCKMMVDDVNKNEIQSFLLRHYNLISNYKIFIKTL
jgi:hypothetical protein